jgi:hypothetical protein
MDGTTIKPLTARGRQRSMAVGVSSQLLSIAR